jgi:hypothetical protein
MASSSGGSNVLRQLRAQSDDGFKSTKVPQLKVGKLLSLDRCGRRAMTVLTVSRRAKSNIPGWHKQRSERNLRLEAGSRYASGRMATLEKAKALFKAVTQH